MIFYSYATVVAVVFFGLVNSYILAPICPEGQVSTNAGCVQIACPPSHYWLNGLCHLKTQNIPCQATNTCSTGINPPVVQPYQAVNTIVQYPVAVQVTQPSPVTTVTQPCPVTTVTQPCPVKPVIPCPTTTVTQPCPVNPQTPCPTTTVTQPCPVNPVTPCPTTTVTQPCPVNPVTPCPTATVTRPCPVNPQTPCPTTTVTQPCPVNPVTPCPTATVTQPCPLKPVTPCPTATVTQPCPVNPVTPCPTATVTQPCPLKPVTPCPTATVTQPCPMNPSTPCPTTTVTQPCPVNPVTPVTPVVTQLPSIYVLYENTPPPPQPPPPQPQPTQPPIPETTTPRPEPTIRCPQGTILINRYCHLIYCGSGIYQQGKCIVTVCPEGTIWNGSRCKAPEPRNQTTLHFSNVVTTNINQTAINPSINFTNNIEILITEEPIQVVVTPPTLKPELPEKPSPPSDNCCYIIPPPTCSWINERYVCKSRKTKRCGPVCTGEFIYLLPPPPEPMAPPPPPPPPSPPSPPCPTNDCGHSYPDEPHYPDCNRCEQYPAESCRSYCRRPICRTRACQTVQLRTYCESYPGSIGCQRVDGCTHDWCGGY